MAEQRPTRRGLLAGLTFAAAAPLVTGAANPLSAATPNTPAPTSKAPWWLIAPLEKGDHLSFGWSIQGLSDVERGAAVLTLVHPQHGDARIHLCERKGAGRGLAQTQHLDFVLMDGNTGDQATDEALGRVILGLAAHVRSVESGSGQKLAGLMTHEDRERRFPNGVY